VETQLTEATTLPQVLAELNDAETGGETPAGRHTP
jgi:hypothetical protein